MDQMGKEANAADNARRGVAMSRLPRVFSTKFSGDTTAISSSDAAATYKTKPCNGVSGELDKGGTMTTTEVAAIFPTQTDWKIRIGSRVCVGGAKLGTLLYYGDTKFASGAWCGVMLDETVGKNDGAVGGIRYFTCPAQRGLFAPPHKVQVIEAGAGDNIEVGGRPEDLLNTTTTIATQNGDADDFRKTWPPPLPGEATAKSSSIYGSDDQLARPSMKRPLLMNQTTAYTPRAKVECRRAVVANGDLDKTLILPNKLTWGSLAAAAASAATTTSSPTKDEEHDAGGAQDATFCLDKPSPPPRFVTAAATREWNSDLSASPSVVVETGSAAATKLLPQNTSSVLLGGSALLNDTFTIENVEASECDIVTSPLTGIKEEQEACGKDVAVPLPFVAASDDYWQLVEQEEEDEDDLSGAEFGTMDGRVRQGSLEMDESLGILTAEQMKDFTFYSNDIILVQTPSDESIQEIVEEEALLLPEVNSGRGYAEGNVTFDVDTPVVVVEEQQPAATETRNGNSQNPLPLHPLESKTSTPFQTDDWKFDATTKGIMDVMTPQIKSDQSHFSDVSEAFGTGRKALKVDFHLEFDLSSILDENLTVDNKRQAVVGLEELLETKKSVDRTADDVLRDLSAISDKELLRPAEEEQQEAVVVANAAAATEIMMLQQVVTSLTEHVAAAAAKKELPTAMAASVTSTDTGYQGDAECDLQSEMGTNAANTPVEDAAKDLEVVAMLAEAVAKQQHGKAPGDPGSDSDFCSDMATSLTESEMESGGGDDSRLGRGRGARIIDGRLYYSSNAATTTTAAALVSRDSACSSQLLEPSKEQEQTVECSCQEEVEAAAASTMPECEATVLEKSDATVMDAGVTEDVRDPEILPHAVVEPTRREEKPMEAATTSGEKFKDHPLVVATTTPKEAEVTPKFSSKLDKSLLGSSSSKKNSKKESPAATKKSPRKNVMSKIKSLIEATSHILANKESPSSTSKLPSTAAGAASGSELSSDKKKAAARTPKKSRWDAVMSKIAAGQAEEKTKARKEATSKVKTNLLTAQPSSSRHDTKEVQSPPPKKCRSNVGSSSASKSVTRGSGSSDAVATSQHDTEASRSTIGGASKGRASSAVASNLRLPRSGKLARPSMLSVVGSAAPAALNDSRSPSQASVFSSASHGSTLSQFTMASQASTRPPHDASLTSADRSRGRHASARSVPAGAASSSSRIASYTSKQPTVASGSRPSTTAVGLARTITTLNRTTAVTAASGRVPQTSRSQTKGGGGGVVSSSSRNRSAISVFRVGLGSIGGGGGTGTSSHKEPGGQLKSLKTSSGQSRPLFQQQQQENNNRLLHSSSMVKRQVVSTTNASAASREVTRLEALCEARTKELNYARMQLRHCAVGFDSLAILLQYLTQDLNAFATPHLAAELKQVRDELLATQTNLEESRNEHRRLQDELVRLQEQANSCVEEVQQRMTREMEENTQRLLGEHAEHLDKLSDCHSREIKLLREEQDSKVCDLREDLEKQLKESDCLHDEEFRKLKDDYNKELKRLGDLHESEKSRLQSEHLEATGCFEAKVDELGCECNSLRSQVQSLKNELARDTDYRVVAAVGRCNNLQNEVDSLKAVLELRQSELQELRKEKLELISESEELSATRHKIKKLEAKVEDMHAMMDIRLKNERQLSCEHQMLVKSLEKESKMSKRLSMEKEELLWRLNQQKEMECTLPTIDGVDSPLSRGGDQASSSSSSNMSTYFWDHEGMLNISFNGTGSVSSQKTCFSCFKGLNNATAKSPPPRGNTSRTSPSKSPTANGRPMSAPVLPFGDRRRRSRRAASTSDDEFSALEEKVCLRKHKGSARVSLCQTFVEQSVSAADSAAHVVLNGRTMQDELPEDILVANEAFATRDDAEEEHALQNGIYDVTVDDGSVDTRTCDVPNVFKEPSEVFEVLQLEEDDDDHHNRFSDAKDAVSIDSYENTESSSPDLQALSNAAAAAATTTKLVISYRSTLHSLDSSSRGSSPIPPNAGTASESCESRSSSASDSSSSRASPLAPDEDVANKSSLHLLDNSNFDGVNSPRVSAGESMMLLDEPQSSHLLKRVLHDQMLCAAVAGEELSCGSLESTAGARETPRDGGSSPLLEISKPNTPESTSQAVGRTDSTNMDLSWSEDDMPFETEV